jgi:hypothetical protein
MVFPLTAFAAVCGKQACNLLSLLVAEFMPPHPQAPISLTVKTGKN